jgi:hypothetical protein
MDLFLSHEVTTAITEPKPIPDLVTICVVFSVKSCPKTNEVMDSRNTSKVSFFIVMLFKVFISVLSGVLLFSLKDKLLIYLTKITTFLLPGQIIIVIYSDLP